MTTPPAWVAPGQPGFLASERLYFRAPELADARYPAVWHFAPYPITPERAEKLLKEDIARSETFHYIACRRQDDLPVGAARVDEPDGRTATVRVRVDPRWGGAGDGYLTEMIETIVRWLGTERNSMIIWVELDGPSPDLLAAVERLGLTPAVRLREAVWRDGTRVDRYLFEFHHPFWVERLGDPGAGVIDASPPTDVATSRRVSLVRPAGPVPANALLVSERLALRLTGPDDANEISRLIRNETEWTWGRGRWLISPLQITHWIEADQQRTPPAGLSLAVILRATGELIGEVELSHIDWFNRTAETGSFIHRPEFRSQGYGTEAKNLLLEYAFDYLDLHMVRSFIWSFNHRSQAAIRKQGYRAAGRMQWRAQTSTGFASNTAFDLLAREWRARVGPRPD